MRRLESFAGGNASVWTSRAERVAIASAGTRAAQQGAAKSLMTAMHALTQLATVGWTLGEDRSEAPAFVDDPRGASVAVVRVVESTCSASRVVKLLGAGNTFELITSASALCDANGRALGVDGEHAAQAVALSRYNNIAPPDSALRMVNGTSDLVVLSLGANPYAALASNVTATRVLSIGRSHASLGAASYGGGGSSRRRLSEEAGVSFNDDAGEIDGTYPRPPLIPFGDQIRV